MKLARTALAAILVAVVGYLVWPRSGQQVRPEEARRLDQAGALLLDVRTAQEFSAGHLPGAQNIRRCKAWRRVGRRLGIQRRRSSLLSLGRAECSRSEVLKQRGFANVSDLGAMSR